MQPTAVIVTSISSPTRALIDVADGCARARWKFLVVGDETTPFDFSLAGCAFYGVHAQTAFGSRFAGACPLRTYARKNIGYLLAMASGVELIVETDDDNVPLPGFWASRLRVRTADLVLTPGWVNVYRYFTDAYVWPRGLPLEVVKEPPPELQNPAAPLDCPIQSGLSDEDPDVDAVYRLILPLPVRFRTRQRPVALGPGAWCPFNSQNVTWWADAFPLLYLPVYCTIRMTDIWRSLVAQRIGWENGWQILYHEPTVRQERNRHNLMSDFEAEVPGFLLNRRIAERLASLSLVPGLSGMEENLRRCYDELIRMGVLDRMEMPLLEAWISDLNVFRRGPVTTVPYGGGDAKTLNSANQPL